MLNKIFLDLDDVLCVLVPTYLKILGCGDIDYSDINPEWGYDIVDIVSNLQSKIYTSENIWSFATHKMWVNLPETQEAKWLLNQCILKVGRENVFILTKPTEDPLCVAGKVEWIQRFLPIDMVSQYFIGAHKYLCAKEDTLLIDDNEDNINLFKINHGSGILVPRPWNSIGAFDIKIHITKELDKFNV